MHIWNYILKLLCKKIRYLLHTHSSSSAPGAVHRCVGGRCCETPQEWHRLRLMEKGGSGLGMRCGGCSCWGDFFRRTCSVRHVEHRTGYRGTPRAPPCRGRFTAAAGAKTDTWILCPGSGVGRGKREARSDLKVSSCEKQKHDYSRSHSFAFILHSYYRFTFELHVNGTRHVSIPMIREEKQYSVQTNII
jgi:hypothetical protein